MKSGLAVLLFMLAMVACHREAPLQVYWKLPDFQLAAQTGQPFDSKSLNGSIWIADFIYTTCTGPCPRMSSQMRGVQSAVAAYPDVKLVSITVDPKHDTPDVLAVYARRYHADPARWVFLTGDPAALHALCRDGFKLGDVDGSLVHSTRLVLVDRQGRVRGFYSTSEDDATPHLLRDIRNLKAEK